MPWSPRRKVALSLAIAFVCFGTAVIVWRNTSGVSGEIFVITENGKAVVAPGATLILYKIDESQANKITSDLGRKFEAYIHETGEHISMLTARPDELTHAYVESLNKISARKYCLQLHSVGTDATQRIYISSNADRGGRFSLAATPGAYFLYVSGQAGETHAEWFQIVRVRWREQLRLVQPTCSYSSE